MPKTQNRFARAAFAIAFVLGTGAVHTARADTVSLMWDLNAEPVDGYLLYVGTQSGIYSQTIDVGNTGSHVFTTTVPGQRYYFTVAAYAGNAVSGRSNEVSAVSNAPPTLANPGNQTSAVGQVIALQLVGADPLGDPLTYSATGLPTGLMVSQVLGLITGVTTTAGTYNVTATVSDGVLAASQSFAWTVQASANVAPTLAAPGNQTGQTGVTTSLQLVGSDANGDTLTYGASGLPPGLAMTAGTGRIAGTPTTTGSYTVTATVSDGSLSASRTFTWTIQSVNVAPTLTNPLGQTGEVGVARRSSSWAAMRTATR
jgi:hypothetical protein